MASQGYRNKSKAIAGGAAKNCGPHYYNKKKKNLRIDIVWTKSPWKRCFHKRKTTET